MERLTIRTPKGASLKMNDQYVSEAEARADLMRRYLIAIDRLAAYEDTGLGPEEIEGLCTMEKRAKMADLLRLEEYQEFGSINHLRELVQAERDGRMVVYGRWDGEGDGYADGEIVLDVWYCSACGHCIDDGTDDPYILPNYCPNCGAKMDSERIP